MDPYLRVGIFAALGGAVVGLALVLFLREPSTPPITERATTETMQPLDEAVGLILPDPPTKAETMADAARDFASVAPLDEIPPELVLDTPAMPPRAAPAATSEQAQEQEAEPENVTEIPLRGPEAGDSAIAEADGSTSPASDYSSVASLTPPVVLPQPQFGLPMVAIVIDDMGLDRRRSRQVVNLLAPLTLSYLTYAEDLPAQTRRANARGHQLMLHVAMEPTNPDIDAGPDVLLTRHSEAEILSRLTHGLDQFDGFVGINNHMGSKFTADRASLMTVMAELNRRRLFFLDSRTSAKSVADQVAFEFGVPFAVRNVFLDDQDDEASVMARLNETARIAKRQGHAIAIGHPKDRTIAALKTWLPRLANLGVQLVPASIIIDKLMAPVPE